MTKEQITMHAAESDERTTLRIEPACRNGSLDAGIRLTLTP